jgi:hypothetical protein
VKTKNIIWKAYGFLFPLSLFTTSRILCGSAFHKSIGLFVGRCWIGRLHSLPRQARPRACNNDRSRTVFNVRIGYSTFRFQKAELRPLSRCILSNMMVFRDSLSQNVAAITFRHYFGIIHAYFSFSRALHIVTLMTNVDSKRTVIACTCTTGPSSEHWPNASSRTEGDRVPSIKMVQTSTHPIFICGCVLSPGFHPINMLRLVPCVSTTGDNHFFNRYTLGFYSWLSWITGLEIGPGILIALARLLPPRVSVNCKPPQLFPIHCYSGRFFGSVTTVALHPSSSYYAAADHILAIA